MRRPRICRRFCAGGALLFSAFVLRALLPDSPAIAQQQPPYRVVVNAANPVDELPRSEVSRIFLKKRTAWPSGFAITPVDQSVSSDARVSFSNEVHLKKPAAVESYWGKLIFSGMGTPPLQVASDAEVLEFIRRNVGAIGYVSGSADLGEGVKVLEVTE